MLWEPQTVSVVSSQELLDCGGCATLDFPSFNPLERTVAVLTISAPFLSIWPGSATGKLWDSATFKFCSISSDTTAAGISCCTGGLETTCFSSNVKEEIITALKMTATKAKLRLRPSRGALSAFRIVHRSSFPSRLLLKGNRETAA